MKMVDVFLITYTVLACSYFINFSIRERGKSIAYEDIGLLLLQLLIEDDQVTGGFINIQEELNGQLTLIFPNLKEKSLKDLDSLWIYFVKDHYISILE